ncbi:MAG: nitroreductase family protein [Nitrospirae bacterium]|nr:nitroreductase family protein [Nitrospirota bacterium]
MEVLEAIRKRRTVRVPFTGEKVPEDIISMLMDVSNISPSGDPISWRLARVDDAVVKAGLARIVKEDFGDYFQKDGERFRRVFSEYPKWLRFSAEAQDGIRLGSFPKAARYFYSIALGRRFGPLFGKLGVMNAEIKSYCRNIMSNPVLFGVFLDRRVNSTAITPILNTGSMLQNLRLAATSLGLCYQDLGWITATKTASDKARKLLGMLENYVAVNFFRIGYTDGLERESKRSDFRRNLKDIVHVGQFGGNKYHAQPIKKTDIQLLDAIRGQGAKRDSQPVLEDDMSYILEAARWAPTGFNVQPFEFIVTERDGVAAIVVLENRERRDPDPGPCEALARGGVLQNIRLAARACGLIVEIKNLIAIDKENVREEFCIPKQYTIVTSIKVKGGSK